jgi:beta-lactamase regulating signal transducer with metallopeptidase domain
MSAAAHPVVAALTGALATAVLHALWQDAVIALFAAVALALARRSARLRYAIACVALFVLLGAFAFTFITALAIGWPSPGAAAATEPVPFATAAPASSWSRPLQPFPVHARRPLPSLPSSLVALAWIGGCSTVAARTFFQFVALRRVVRSARFDVRDRWREAFDALVPRMQLQSLVRLGHSIALEGPAVVGWLSPVVLIPLSASRALSPDQVRALLAHELAHIARRDHLVNALQQVAEALLFFHPATWWLSRRIRVEREYCCDDVAVQVTGDALVYARALSQLETLRAHRRQQLALGANGGLFMHRIQRVVGVKRQRGAMGVLTAALVALAIATAGATFVVVDSASAASGSDNAAEKTPATLTCDRLAAELAVLVKEGKVTQEQTDAKLAACKGPAPKKELTCDQLAAELAVLLKEGKITQEQADAKLAACKGPTPQVAVQGG